MELNWTPIQNKKDELIQAYGKALEAGTTSGVVVFKGDDDSPNFTFNSIAELDARIEALKSIINTLKTKSAKSWTEHLADLDANRDLLINNGAFNVASHSENGVSIVRNSMLDYKNYRAFVVSQIAKANGSEKFRVYSF